MTISHDGGDALDCGHGTYGLRGDLLALFHGLDRLVLGWACELGAEPRRYPALMSTALLLKTDYYRSFPDQATFATSARPEAHAELRSFVSDGSLDAHLERPVAQLRPALCYHVYDELAGTVLEGDLQTFTIFGSCYRHEHTPSKLERQREFTMREIVFAGEAEAVAGRRAELRSRSEALATELGLAVTTGVATDPFWGSANKGRLLYQRERQLKWELRQKLSSGVDLAIASFNLHEETFAKAFGIHRDASREQLASTGCAGWGYERWVAALTDRHGYEPTRWPGALRALADRDLALAHAD